MLSCVWDRRSRTTIGDRTSGMPVGHSGGGAGGVAGRRPAWRLPVDDVVDLDDLGLAGVDTKLRENRPETGAERIELRLRIPDHADLEVVPRPEQISQSWPSAGEMPRRRAWRPHGRTARQSATQGRTGLAHYGGPLVPVAFAPTPLRVSSVSGRRSHDGAARSGDIAEHLPRPGLSVPGTFSTGQRGEAGGVGTCRAEGMSGLGAARPCDACWSILPGMVDR
jgi:hypothetical protein